jgi:hypothetical protein
MTGVSSSTPSPVPFSPPTILSGPARAKPADTLGQIARLIPLRKWGRLVAFRKGKSLNRYMKTSVDKTCSRKRLILGQPSWRLASKQVEAYVTETGGHVGPVTFHLPGRKVQPYSVAPWAEEKDDPKLIPILKALRGDFFCLPFGGNATPFGGERHPVHGETANAKWRFVDCGPDNGHQTLHLQLRTRVRKGCVDKRISLVNGHHAIYSEHILSGMNGPMNLGHHAMIKFPDSPGSGWVATSRFTAGFVFPQPFELPEQRGYSQLKPGAEFRALDEVPTITGGTADLTRYPARRGFEDLVMLISDVNVPFSWTAVTFPKERYVWFALKDPRVLRNTIFWISNGGRHYPPWNGRHINVMGLEEVTSHFHVGLAESARKNPLTARGYPTCLQLTPNQPLRIAYIMAVAVIPQGFDHVSAIEVGQPRDTVILRSVSGKVASAPLNVGFLDSSPTDSLARDAG